MKVARDESGKFGFEYPEDGKYGYKAERGSGTGAMGTMQVNVTIHNRETNEVMHIKDMNYLEFAHETKQETLAMIWDENKDLIQKEDAGEDKDVEKAKQIAKDKAGDMTGASQDIDKVKKGLTKHPDVADALKRANEELNRITKLAGLKEGASMLPYYKDPKDEKQRTWTFPDAWQKDEELDTPYMSNVSMRQFLDALGYDPNFEDQSPVPAKEFIARTTQWLQKNIDKPSAEIPATVDQNPGGPTMYSGGREEGHMNRVVKGHNELARKIVAKYPEVTHFGFN